MAQSPENDSAPTYFSERCFSCRNEFWVSFEKLSPVGTSSWMVRLHLQVLWEQDFDTLRGQSGLMEGNTAGLLQESQPNLVCIVPDNVSASQGSRSNNNHINKSKHMTQDRKLGLSLAKSSFSFAKR